MNGYIIIYFIIQNGEFMTSVAITQHKRYDDLKKHIEKHFDFHGGINTFIQSGDKVLIKPNLLAEPKSNEEPVTTDGRMIFAVAGYLRDHGAKVSVGDSPAFSTVSGILRKIGVFRELKDIGVDIIDFNRPEERFKSYSLDIALKEHNKLINLPKLKVHCQLRVTLSIKNLFGCVTGKRKALLHLAHGDRQNDFAEMLAKNYYDIKPVFTLVDAIDVMEKRGPRGGVRKNVGLMISGVDCVAIDRVLINALGIPLDEYRILTAARDLNIGEWRLDRIKLLGESKIPSIELEFPLMLPITFSPLRVIKSTIKNALIRRREMKNERITIT